MHLRWLAGATGAVALAASLGCGPRSKPPWQTGFWLWHTDSTRPRPQPVGAAPLDVLFVETRSGLPEQLPAAREYWLVLRFDARTVPELQAARDRARLVTELRESARGRSLPLAGVQLDLDSPTRELPRYAAFLREFRKAVGPGLQVSITALLDWFRPDTGIAQVIDEVDEFVPQFYDAAERLSQADSIAAPFDAARWGPVFNRFGKRFRIGLSTFGRLRTLSSAAPSYGFTSLRPIDFGANPAFQLRSRLTDARELALRYEATRDVEIGYSSFHPGEGALFMIPTLASVFAAVEQARRVGGSCAGVLFFRWPAGDESLTLEPEDLLGTRARQTARLQVLDGECAVVHCVDLMLDFTGVSPPAPEPARYRINASEPLEYFVPHERTPARLSGASAIEVPLPPYTGLGRIALGRAVALKRSEYTLERGPP